MIGDIIINIIENPVILILVLVAAIIVIVLVINFISRRRKKRKKEEEVMPKLNEWVKQAKAAGMNYTQARTKLEISGWDTKYVQKALKNNGMEKPEGYVD